MKNAYKLLAALAFFVGSTNFIKSGEENVLPPDSGTAQNNSDGGGVYGTSDYSALESGRNKEQSSETSNKFEKLVKPSEEPSSAPVSPPARYAAPIVPAKISLTEVSWTGKDIFTEQFRKYLNESDFLNNLKKNGDALEKYINRFMSSGNLESGRDLYILNNIVHACQESNNRFSTMRKAVLGISLVGALGIGGSLIYYSVKDRAPQALWALGLFIGISGLTVSNFIP